MEETIYFIDSIIRIIEMNNIYINNFPFGEPQLGKEVFLEDCQIKTEIKKS